MTLLPARSLFWRAFLTFWGAMAVILVCGTLVIALISNWLIHRRYIKTMAS